MSFTSYKYALFVMVAFSAYYLVARLSPGRARPQNLVLILLGYGFYAIWNWRWCLLLASVTLSGYFGALLIHRTRLHRRLVLLMVLIVNLAVLGFFKYFRFFTDSVASLLGQAGLHADWVTINIVLPLGISYYVFQNLSYVIDVYRDDLTPVREFPEYAAALSFFPALLAGPITRPRDLLPQLRLCRVFDDSRARDGIRQILWGLFKKMLVADTIGAQVDWVWANAGTAGGLAPAIAMFLYSIQIYCDFSGYADIAIGTGKLFNLRLSKNFDYPYFSTSVRVFWRRWHMTLSGWMRDYVYIPLGGNRVGAVRNSFNVISTFFLVGLWHGASWTFAIWGLMHGSYLALENAFRLWGKANRKTAPASRPRTVLSALLVFALVSFTWIFFRAPSLGSALHFIARIFTDPWESEDHLRYLKPCLLSVALLAYEWLTRRWEHGLAIARLPLPVRWATYATLILVVVVFGELGGQEGIYVQF